MNIISCQNCNTRVLPRADGSCPACQATADRDEAEQRSDDDAKELVQRLKSQVQTRREFQTAPIDLRQICFAERRRRFKGALRATECMVWLICMATAIAIGFWLATEIQSVSGSRGRFAGRAGMSVVAPLVYVFLLLAARAFYSARRLLRPDARTIMRRDKRSPVLLLRAFSDDGSYEQKRKSEQNRWERIGNALFRADRYFTRTDEEKMAFEVTRCVGPVVAIGRPGEPIPELGAYRFYVDDAHWKAEISELIDRAQLVILRPSGTPGFLWEMNRVLESVAPEKIVFYNERKLKLGRYIYELIPVTLTQPLPQSRFVFFDAAWTPRSGSSVMEFLMSKGLYSVDERLIALRRALYVMIGLLLIVAIVLFGSLAFP